MNRACPYCGYNWHIRDRRKMELLKYNLLSMRCNECGKPYELQKVDRTVYVRYNGENGSVRERIGTIGEFA